MKKHGMLGPLLLLSLAAATLSGCGEETEGGIEDNAENPYAGVFSMEETPVVDYVVPRLEPNLLVDIRGYVVGDEKSATVKGKSLPEEFRLFDAATDRVVYRGPVENVVYHDELGIYSGTLDFGEADTAGEYYLECDVVGRSNIFPVNEQIYISLFNEVYSEMAESCGKGSLDLESAAALLEACEWYSDVFPDADQNEIPDVLRELRSWISYKEENGIEEGEEAGYAALLAKFSYLYQKFDRQYATDCLRRATTVFGHLRGSVTEEAEYFWAMTELYRATGRYTYRNQIAGYKSFFLDSDNYLDDRAYLYAAMTYMDTHQRVDVELCQSFMNDLMQEAEEISKTYTDLIHPVTAENDGPGSLMEDAVKLSCANYVTNNYQYTEIIEEFLHYLMGQNLETVCFYDEGENRGEYLLLFAQLAENHQKGQ